MKMLKKRHIILSILILLISLFFVSPTLSKYRNETVRRVVNLFTRYSVNYVTAGGRINNAQNFSSYLSIYGLTLPTEDDVDRIGFDFNGWYEDNSFIGDPITRIASGSEGDKTFYASWTISRYTLTASVSYEENNNEPGLPDDWDLVIGKDNYGNDNVITLDSNGQIVVDKGETVSLRTRYSADASLSGWTINEDIVFTERYEVGDQYIYYDFRMPRHDVSAIYGVESDNCIDISSSPITFEEGVDIGSRTQDGFWYQSTIVGMNPLKTDATKGNFYAWNNSDDFCVTSRGIATKNQLTVVGPMKVYLKDVNMVKTDYFTAHASGKKFDNYDIVLNEYTGDTSQYANIIIDNSIHTAYTSYFYLVGHNNTVNSIIQKQFIWTNEYINTVYIYGSTTNKADSTLELGTVLGNLNVYFNYLTINEYDNDFDLLVETYRSNTGGAIQFTNSTVNAPTKEVIGKAAPLTFSSTKAELAFAYGHSNFTVSGSSYLRVRGDAIVGYGGVVVSGSSSLIVDGNCVTTYSHATGTGTVNTTGFVIVKGSIFEINNMTFTKGTVIANELQVGRTFNFNGGTLITNQIIQKATKSPAYDRTTEKYIHNATPSTSYSVLVTDNDDNLPFVTYSQPGTQDGVFSFAGSNIYLLGYYQTTYYDNNYWLDTSIDLSTSNNSIRYLVYGKENTNLPILIDGNGDLVSSPSISGVDLEDFVDTYGIPSSETIIVGNSLYAVGTSRVRTVSITGGKIYSAGNITFFNDTNVSGGTITTTGTFSSKRDLTISNSAVINASKVGNKKAIEVNENGLKRYAKTIVSGGTITTDSIGAIDANSYSNVTLGGATINGITSNSIAIQSDTYVNYFANSSDFNADTSNHTLRFNGSITNGSNATLQTANMVLPTQRYFPAPIVRSNNSNGLWAIDSVNGNVIEYVDIYGQVNGSNSHGNLYNIDKIALYAVKGSYNLNVKTGSNYISSVTSGGSQLLFTNDSVEVEPNKTIVINYNDNSMLDKTIIWYYDGNGIIHNVMPTKDTVNGTMTFVMPPADTEIYITSTMTLYLNKTPLTFTTVGFNTDFGELVNDEYTFDSDREFEYAGNYIISHSQITKTTISSSTASSSPISTTPSGKSTSNKVHFLDDFDNTSSNSQTITLNKLVQLGVDEYSGFKLDDGAKVNVLLDGGNQLYLVEVPYNSNITFKGIHGNRTDALSVRNGGSASYASVGIKTGKGGNITYEDLKLAIRSGASGGLAYGSSSTDKTVTFKNCSLNRTNWASSSYVTRYYKNVVFDNSDFNVAITTSSIGYVFVGATNVRMINGTTFEYLYGSSSTYAVPIFYTTTSTSTLEIIDSDLIVNNRNSTASTLYQERHANTEIFTNVILSGNSSLTANQKLNLRNLTVNGTSNVTVNSGNGYLFAQNITLNGGTINAGYIIVSGYYYPTTTSGSSESRTKDALMNTLDAGLLVLNGSSYNGLIVNNGTINASEFIGGDKNAKVTINGGIVNAKSIGTSGKLYGYTTLISQANEEYVYSLEKIPGTGTIVNITGGTVNVLANGYLGGMHAAVNISGGIVNLGTGAVVGINNTDRTTLYNDATSQGNTPSNFVNVGITGGEVTGVNGIISTPYSTLNVSGSTTGINVDSILADKGTINISNANSKYICPIDNAVNVGIKAITEIGALNVNIENGASVYGGRIAAKTIDTADVGTLLVDSTSSIYTNSYGSEGPGIGTITVNGTAVGSRQYSIRYIMNDTYQDPATNLNSQYYVTGSGLQLGNPTRFGYTFAGWYENDNLITEVNTSATGDKEIEARWTPNKVGFRVTITASDVGLSQSEFVDAVSGLNGVLNGNTFTFNEVVEIDYRELIVSSNGINLMNYNLNNHQALSIKINNNTLNPDGEEIYVTSTRVSREIMEYYLINNEEPIEIAIVSIS